MSVPRTDWSRLSGPDGHDRMVQLLGAAASAPVREQEHAWRRFAEAMTDQVDRLGTDEQVVRDTWDGDAAEAAVALAERVRTRARSLVALTTALAADLGTVADAIETAHRELSGPGTPPVWDPAGWAAADDPATETARRVMTTLSDEYVRSGSAMPEPVAGPPAGTGPTPVTGLPRAPGPEEPHPVGGRIPVSGRPTSPRPGTTLGPIGVAALGWSAGHPPFDGDPPRGLPLHQPDPVQPPFSGDPPRGMPPDWRPVDPVPPLGGDPFGHGTLPVLSGIGLLLLPPAERRGGPGLVPGDVHTPFGRVDVRRGADAGASDPGADAVIPDPALSYPTLSDPTLSDPARSDPARSDPPPSAAVLNAAPAGAGQVLPDRAGPEQLVGGGRLGGVAAVLALGAVAGTSGGVGWTDGETVRDGRFSRLVGRLTGRVGRTAPAAESFGTPVVQHDAPAVRAADGGAAVPGSGGGGRLPVAPNTAGGGTGGAEDTHRRASWLTEQEDVWGIGGPGADGVLGGPTDGGAGA